MLKKLVLSLFLIIQFCYAENIFYYKGDKKVTLIPVERDDFANVVYDVDYYKTEAGIILGVTDKLIVKLKDSNMLDNFLFEYNLSLIENLYGSVYLFRTTDKSETIKISNLLHEDENVVYAKPDFRKKIISR